MRNLSSTKQLQKTTQGLILFTCFFLAICLQGFAQGDLLIFPKRLVFEGTQNRVQTLNLNNNGRDTATYRLSYVENRMNKDGHFELIEEPDAGQQFASPYLRFYPRTITLAPGETQVVKVQLTRTSELETGEYRSHLYFRAVPETKARQPEDKQDAEPEGISIKLLPVYGISIANIIRIGDPEVQVDLSNLVLEKFNDSLFVISMDFSRSGLASSYGDITIKHISAAGKETTVGEMDGFAVYTPGSLRRAKIELRSIDGVDFNSGTLEAIYTSQGSAKSVYARANLQL